MTVPVRPPLQGEVIAPGESLSVIAFMHPMRTSHELVTVASGASVEEIVAACGRQRGMHRLTEGMRVTINGDDVPEAMWKRLRIRRSALTGEQPHIVVRAVPGAFLLPIALSALSTALTPLFGSFLTSIIVGGVGLLASLAISALFPPAQTKAEKASTLYSIAAARNEVAKWEPVPAVLGKVRMAAKYAASPYTIFEGDDQSLYMLLVWGIGPLDVRDIKIGETPIDDYDDVEHETFYGYLNPPDYEDEDLRGKPDYLNQTIFPREVVQDDVNITTSKDNGPHLRTSAQDGYKFQIDLTAPNGLYEQKNEGADEQNVDLKIEYRVLPSGSFHVLKAKYQLIGDSSDPIRRSLTISPKLDEPTFKAGQIEVRITQLTEDHEDNDNIIVDTVIWTALRTFRRSPPIEQVPPLAITAIKIKATDQLNGTPDDINAIVTAKGPHWTGSTWIDDAKIANPADLYRLILQGAANKRPVADAKIDLARLQSFHNRCDAKGFTFSMARDFRTSVWDALRDVCAAGRAVPLFRDGIWSVAWEDASAPIVQHFTPRNSWGMHRRQEYRSLPDALRCKFLNAKKGWVEDEMLVFPVGSAKNKNSPNLRTEQVEFPGVTDPADIVKLACYRLAEGKLRPATFTLSTDLDHLVCTRGDRVYVASDVLMNTLGFGRVKAVAGQTITLDQPVAMEPGKSYGIRFRLADGTSLLRTVTTDPGITTAITLAGSGGVPAAGGDKSAGDLYSFGPLGQEAGVYRIKEIRHNDDLTAELEMVDDAPEIEDADDKPIPDYDSGIVPPVDPTTILPAQLVVRESLQVTGGVGTNVATLTFEHDAFALVREYYAQAIDKNGRKVEGNTDTANRTSVWRDLAPGIWTFRVLARYRDRSRNKWSEPITVNIVGRDAVPPDLPKLNVAIVGRALTLTPSRAARPVMEYVYRYSPKTTPVTWEKMVEIGTSPTPAFTTKLRDGTYACKARSYGSVGSLNAVYAVVIDSGIIGTNVTDTVSEPGTFAGGKALTVVEDNELRLALGGNFFAPANFFGPANFFAPGGEQSYVKRGYYYIPGTLDLGAVYTSSLEPRIDARGSTMAVNLFDFANWFGRKNFFGFSDSDWGAAIEISLTRVDPALAQWSGWDDLVAGDYTFRAAQFRLRLDSFETGVTPRVASASILVDMPDGTRAGKDIATSATAATVVTFAPAFRELRGISIAAQDMATGDRFAITAKSAAGFTIRFFNSAGTGVARTFDYTATGYGVKKS